MVGVTRTGVTVPGVDEAIGVDLRPRRGLPALAPASGTTHLFFAAYFPQASWAEGGRAERRVADQRSRGVETVGPAPALHADHRRQRIIRIQRPHLHHARPYGSKKKRPSRDDLSVDAGYVTDWVENASTVSILVFQMTRSRVGGR